MPRLFTSSTRRSYAVSWFRVFKREESLHAGNCHFKGSTLFNESSIKRIRKKNHNMNLRVSEVFERESGHYDITNGEERKSANGDFYKRSFDDAVLSELQ